MAKVLETRRFRMLSTRFDPLELIRAQAPMNIETKLEECETRERIFLVFIGTQDGIEWHFRGKIADLTVDGVVGKFGLGRYTVKR